MTKSLQSILLLFSFLMGSMCSLYSAEPYEIVELSVTLRAANPETSQQKILSYIESAGGYFVYMSGSALVAYVPAKVQVSEILSKIKENGYSLQEELETENSAERIGDLETILEIKTKHLAEVKKLLGGADLETTLDIELELGTITGEIDEIRGELKYLRERSTLKKITVNFEIPLSSDEKKYSGFSWLNNISIPRFLERFP